MLPGPTETPAGSPGWRPWRSVFLARLVTGAALIVGVPLFLRMPPWCDLTLYDVAARNVLTGGVHYRDVFDTNLPGFVWALALVRAVFGWSVEAVRAVDLVIVAVLVMLLDRLAARGGASRWARAWMIAGVAVFYPFTSEVNHCQRDIWMTLPAAAAALIRVRRLSAGQDRAFRSGFVEGVLWGLAVWIKPHVVVAAAAVWAATAPSVAVRGRRALAADLLGNIVGGLVVGAAGIGYLVRSGTWPAFVEVFTFWNAGYARQMFSELPRRLGLQLTYFPPWSYLQLVSLPVAVAALADIRPRNPVDPFRVGRLTLAVLYLGWTAQALLFQREFHYVHVPETILLLAVLATRNWAAGAFGTGWLILAGAAVLAGVPKQNPPTGWPDIRPRPRLALQHPIFDFHRMRHWNDCWQMGLSPVEYRQRMNNLRMVTGFHPANDWEQLGEVSEWLLARGVSDGDVLAWHDAPHAIYLQIGTRPGFRFQHVNQMMSIGNDQKKAIQRELCAAAGHVRFVVSDLELPWMFTDDWPGGFDTAGPDLLPTGFPAELRTQFPYQQPAVFRSGSGRGRYIVHQLGNAIPGCAD